MNQLFYGHIWDWSSTGISAGNWHYLLEESDNSKGWAKHEIKLITVEQYHTWNIEVNKFNKDASFNMWKRSVNMIKVTKSF